MGSLRVGLGVRAAGQDRVMDRAGHPLIGNGHAVDVESLATLAAPSGRSGRVHPGLRVPAAFGAESHDGTTFQLMSVPRQPSVRLGCGPLVGTPAMRVLGNHVAAPASLATPEDAFGTPP